MLISAGTPVGAWFEMDKRNLVNFMQFVANAGLPNAGTSLFGGSIGGPGSIFVADDGTNDTPRDGWKDNSGVDREPTPSDKRSASKTKTVAAETLLQALLTFAGSLVAAGYKTGGKPNLLTRLIVFINAVKNKQPYDVAALGVLLSQIESLAHFSG